MTTSPGTNPSGSSLGRRLAPEELTSGGGLRPGFGGAVGWTVAGTVIPGLGFWRAGHRVLGGVIIGVLVASMAGLGIFAMINPTALTAAATDPNFWYAVAAALLVVALGWVAVITATHLALRPRPASAIQRISGGALVGLLSFAVAAPLAFSANVAYTSASFLSTTFESGSDDTKVDGADPWKGAERWNVLLLGGDSGTKRASTLGARTDTIIVASVDVKTGATTLFTLPRNATKMPFPPDSPLHKYYPNGFTDPANVANAEYFLNAMYRNVPAHVPNDVLGKTKDFGAKAMMVSVGYALGLKIDHYGFVNMDGFKDFMNAIGGITVNVNYRVPIGGRNASGSNPEQAPADYIEIGPNKHLTGGYALWYARGRYHLDDYSRMERQRCVINAVIKQADPATILANYQAVAESGKKTIKTNIPRELLPALLDVGLLAKNAKVRSLVLSPDNGFVFGRPDWVKVRSQVQKSLRETASSSTEAPSASPTPSTSATPGGSATPSASASKKPKSEDLEDACAFHPKDGTKK